MGKGNKMESVAFVVILVFLIFSTLPFATASPDVIYVPDNYATIQEAVNAASPGDIIIVRDGTYKENVVVDVSDLTIKSENGYEHTTIDGGGSGEAVTITANDVKIEGFTITGSGDYGTGLIIKSSRDIITSNNITNNGYGISFFLSSNNSIISNKITSNNECGIYLGSSASNNTITSNKITNNNWGIWLDSSSNNTITSNNITSNSGFGIYLGSSSSNNTIILNDIISNNYSGIFFWSSSNNTITSNSISSNNDSGICLESSSNNNIIILNDIFSNNYSGICLLSSSNNKIYLNNLVNDNNVYTNQFPNAWNSTQKISYTYEGNNYTNYLGNYWSDYTGTDSDGDGIGDTPYSVDSDKDNYPLVQLWENYSAPTEPYTKIDVGVTSNITLASPSDLAAYLPPEYADTDISDSVVLNVNVTDDTPDNETDDAYSDITINVSELDIETCKVFKTGIGFLPEVEDVTTLPTVKPPGEPAFSRDLVNETVTVRLYVGDPLLGVIPPAAPSVFDTGAGTYPSIMGTHKGEIKPSDNITVSKLYTYPCAGTGGHTESIELYENGELIANGTWNGYIGDWHNITIRNLTNGVPYVTLLEGHKYNYTIITGSYPQIIHEHEYEKATGGTITCTSFVDANGKVYYDWIPAIRLE